MAGHLQHHDDGLAHDVGFSPALFGYIWEENHSYQVLRRSKECVINLPTLDLVDTVVGIGSREPST